MAADDVKMPVERPVNEGVTGTHAPSSLVPCLDVASREHDGDISVCVAMPALEGTGRETVAPIPRVGRQEPGHCRRLPEA